jgi:hypothetical protein
MAKYTEYRTIMNAACDAMLEANELARKGITDKNALEVYDNLVERAIQLKEAAEKLESEGLEYEVPNE